MPNRHQTSRPTMTFAAQKKAVHFFDRSESEYRYWRDTKLRSAESSISVMEVEIANPLEVSRAELKKIQQIIDTRNWFVYRLNSKSADNTADTATISRQLRALCRQLGLSRSITNPAASEKNVSQICSTANGIGSRYIPYSCKALRWHTDGYYNDIHNQVRSFVLHCQAAATSGGSNSILDHEMAYIQLREQNPDLSDAFCRPNSFTIPADDEIDLPKQRPEFSGAVFSIDSLTNRLYARYTQRERNIIWNQHSDMPAALSAMNSILSDRNPMVVNLTLEPGQGLICNNVLHNRSAFSDANASLPKRLLLRVRFQDRILYHV